MANWLTNVKKWIQHWFGFVLIVWIFLFGLYLVRWRNWLQASDWDTLTAAKWNEIVSKVSNLETQLWTISPLVCPTWFKKVENQGFSLWCIQESTNTTANFNNAMKYCSSQYWWRLPEFNELYVAKEHNWIPKWLRERVSGWTYGWSTHNWFVINITESPTYDTVGTSNIYRCFLPR